MKFTPHLILQLFFCLTLLQIPVMAEEWELVKDGGGVAVYESKWEGYSENQYKGVSVIEQPVEVIAAVLSDIASYPEWFHRCTEARKLKNNETSVLDFLLYIVINVPWPFEDRHGIFQAQTTVDPVSEKIVIHSAARAESDIPPHKDYIRITNSTQRWILEKLTLQTTRITFINQTGSSGSMSAFITNLGSQATVYQSLINMRSVAGRPRYEKLGAELKDRFN